MEQNLHFEQGRVVISEKGDRISIAVYCRNDGLGLYKAWIAGRGAQISLGTLLPQGNALFLQRNLSREMLHRQGCWPALQAGVTVAHRFDAKPGQGWEAVQKPQERFADDPLLSRLLTQEKGCLLREEPERNAWKLAIPFRVNAPFPLSPLFCFCQVRTIRGEQYAVYTFDQAGKPKIPAR